jgi:hypothetical protein
LPATIFMLRGDKKVSLDLSLGARTRAF